MSKRTCCTLMMGLMALSLGARAAQPRPTTDGIASHTPDGHTLWRLRLAQPPSQLRVLDDGAALIDGRYLINARGELLARISADACAEAFAFGGVRSTYGWDVPLNIVDPPQSGSDAHNPPFFDSQGNAWVVNTQIRSGDYALQVRTSNGHTGTWGPLDTISDSTNYVAAPDQTIDNSDAITIAFRDISGGYKLYVMRYEPGSGWSGPTVIHSSSQYFQAIEVGADEFGNVAVVFDLDTGPDTASTMIYDAQNGNWGGPHLVSPAGVSVYMPTILRNRDGSNMYLIYLVAGTGVYAHQFDSDTLAWGPGVLIPGTDITGFSFAGPSTRFPGVVDPAGNATFLWETGDSPYTVYASRLEDGMWQFPRELLPPSSAGADIESFAGISVSAAGDVLGVATRRSDEGLNTLYAFPFRDGAWSPTEIAHQVNYNLYTRSRAALYRGPLAIATRQGPQGGTPQLTSVRYNGFEWQPDLIDIPDVHSAFYSDLAADGGDVLLVYEGENSGNRGIFATFFRDYAGDMNCDGFVNNFDIDGFVLALTDPDGYAQLYPNCDIERGDVNGDGDVNNFDIDGFVAVLTAF